MKTLLLSALCAILLSGCSIFDLANLAAPDDGFRADADIAYGPLPRQRLDIYRPENVVDRQVTLVYFYGGGWRNGSREQYRFIGRKLATEGYTVVIPDYRVYPEVTFPGFVEDGAHAVAAIVRKLRQDYGLPKTTVLAGHSAGAHIAMLLSLDPRYLEALGLSTEVVSGVVGLSGPYDFLPLSSRGLKRIFPGPVAEHDSQPINFVSANAPPTLLLHGDEDRRVWIHNSKNLHAALKAAGVESSLTLYPGVGHGAILKPLVGVVSPNSSLLEDIAAFVSSLTPTVPAG